MLQAHYHGVERLEEQIAYDGTTRKTCFFTLARGGGDHHGWTTKRTGPTDFTRYRLEDSAVSGYLKIYDSPTVLVLEYYDTSHNLLDRIKFTQ